MPTRTDPEDVCLGVGACCLFAFMLSVVMGFNVYAGILWGQVFEAHFVEYVPKTCTVLNTAIDEWAVCGEDGCEDVALPKVEVRIDADMRGAGATTLWATRYREAFSNDAVCTYEPSVQGWLDDMTITDGQVSAESVVSIGCFQDVHDPEVVVLDDSGNYLTFWALLKPLIWSFLACLLDCVFFLPVAVIASQNCAGKKSSESDSDHFEDSDQLLGEQEEGERELDIFGRPVTANTKDEYRRAEGAAPLRAGGGVRPLSMSG